MYLDQIDADISKLTFYVAEWCSHIKYVVGTKDEFDDMRYFLIGRKYHGGWKEYELGEFEIEFNESSRSVKVVTPKNFEMLVNEEKCL